MKKPSSKPAGKTLPIVFILGIAVVPAVLLLQRNELALNTVHSWLQPLDRFLGTKSRHDQQLAPVPAQQQTEKLEATTHEHYGDAKLAKAACHLSGKVADCGCDFASVEQVNQQVLQPLLTKLVQQPFFRFFKVNLYCDCNFWPDAGMCVQRDCCVSECEAGDIPESWKKHDQYLAEWAAKQKASCQGESGVDRSVEEDVRGALSSVQGWHGLNNPWVPEDDQHTDYIYVDLQKNTEKYTGYKGEDARRIWAAIYEQPVISDAAKCISSGSIAHTEGKTPLDAKQEVTHEQRVLYRLISGMHASITTSIVNNFYHEETGTWGPNLGFFKARFASPTSRPYIENLYFTLLFVLRAVQKAGPALSQLDLTSGWPETQGQATRQMVEQLLNSPQLQAACSTPFDEGLLWQHGHERSQQLRQQLQVTFHNITRLMDCVGCEKCKMHGKLNVLGIATALKVLFAQKQPLVDSNSHAEAGSLQPQGADSLVLDRNEAIALLNFLAKLSDSVETVRSLSLQVSHTEQQ